MGDAAMNEPRWKTIVKRLIGYTILTPMWLAFVTLMFWGIFGNNGNKGTGWVDVIGWSVTCLFPIWCVLIDKRYPRETGKRALASLVWVGLLISFWIHLGVSRGNLFGENLAMMAALLVTTLFVYKYGLEPETDDNSRWTHGTARWATENEVANHRDLEMSLVIERQPGSLILGSPMFKQTGRVKGNPWQAGMPLTFTGDTSLLTIGPSGSGKGVSAIIPNLLHYEGSVICIDPKGENASVSARRRVALGQDVLVLDPWEISRGPVAPEQRAAFNPLTGLSELPDERKLDAVNLIADALVVRTGSEKDPHWNDNAEALLRGLIVHCVTAEPSERQNLQTVREYLVSPDFIGVLESMVQNHACGGIAARTAGAFLAKADVEASGVLSTAITHTAFMDNLRMQTSLAPRPDERVVDLGKLSANPTTVFLCIPNQQIEPMKRWLRLFVNLAVNQTMESGRGPNEVLFILDEFPALGRLEIAERAVAEGRGYGLKLWPIVQGLTQLKQIYRDNWETFVSNAGIFQVLGANDQFTAEYVSKRTGQMTVQTRSTSTGHDGRPQVSYGETGRPLMTPDEVINLGEMSSIAFPRGSRGLIVRRIRYHAVIAWKDYWDPNPQH